MVMDASPSPQSVGREFVRQYYTLLNKAPAHLHRFYNNLSSFVHGGLDAPNRETLPVVGQKLIHNRIQQLNFHDCHAKISQVDAQATLGSGVVVQVTGELSNDGAPMRRFTQTFVLAAQSPKKYYVHNDIFRYQDIVFSDDSGSGSAPSEGELEEETGAAGYFSGFPAPPDAPPGPASLAPPLSPPATMTAPHLNGHPPHQDDCARHAAAAAASVPRAVVPAPRSPSPEPELEPALEFAPEPEPEQGLTPPPHHPVVMAPPEPKTYANLLKSGGGAPRTSPPAAVSAPPVAPFTAPPQPQEQRQRAPRGAPPHGGEGRDRDREMREAREFREARDRERERERESREREVREGGGGGGGGGRDGGRPVRYSDAQQLFLGNLPHYASEEELRALFSRFGPIVELRVHSKSGAPGALRHPNYGFITYESSSAAHECLSAAPLYFPPDSADGVKLNVEEKKARGREAPRRRPVSGHRAAGSGPGGFPRAPFRR